ncbi:Wadjet anti-phage system protein JetD domain-containing protein [Leifsonia sp. NPDC058230]|uniref:Wadjet anti-phage system protein JetD domain-containing protein n=1 Tax=Leifsonia sp. NPDC058230 TaxID=3346391 RepID=UPI0036DA8537
MKRPADIVHEIGRRLERTWAQTLTGESEAAAWPHRFSLTTASSRTIAADFTALVDVVADLRAWAPRFDVELVNRDRRIGVVTHSIPSHLVVPSIDEAARICGGVWPSRLQRGRDRLGELRRRFPELAELSGMLRAVDDFDDVDFELLLRAGAWFAENSAAGLTPRQVPLEGFQAKWLNTRQHLVAALAGKADLGLARNHPPRIHFSYLDPGHLARGGRKHDSATFGDSFMPAYAPQIVIISENKDTAINFPDLDGAISVEGVGKGGSTLASFDWLVQAPVVVYWGDMDADGLEILDGFRAAGVPARSIFMDTESFDRWERYGTNVDKHGAALTAREPRPVPNLTDDERALYLGLVHPEWSRARRIEQERVPLDVARAALAFAACEERGAIRPRPLPGFAR